MKAARAVFAVVSVSLAIAAGAQAAKDPIDVLIQRLEEKNVIQPADADSIRAEIAQIERDNAAEAAAKAKSDSAGKSTAQNVTARTAPKIGGYAQVRYTNTGQPGASNTFEARRVRLTFSGDAAPVLGYYVQADLAGSQKGITDTKGTTATFGRATLLDAYLDYRFNPLAKISAGQFKVPFSRESLANDALLDAINRAVVVDRLAPGRDIGSNGRDIGLQFSGTASTGPATSSPAATSGVDYALAVLNGNGINVADENKGTDWAARAVWRPAVAGLSVGASYYNGRRGATDPVKRDRTGLEAGYSRDLYGLRGEYIWGKDAAVKKKGYYATGVFPVATQTQGVLRYETYDPDTSTSGDTTKAWTAGLNYFFTKDTLNRFQLNYEHHRDAGDAKYGALLAQYQAGF